MLYCQLHMYLLTRCNMPHYSKLSVCVLVRLHVACAWACVVPLVFQARCEDTHQLLLFHGVRVVLWCDGPVHV